MESKLKKIIAYDLETTGLIKEMNQIAEFAGVVIDLDTLEIEDEITVIIKPRFDFSFITDDLRKEAKTIFSTLSEKVKDGDLINKELKFGEDIITPKSIPNLQEPIRAFKEVLDNLVTCKIRKDKIFTYDEVLELKNDNKELIDIINIYINMVCNPSASAVTHITIDSLLKDGIEFEEAFKKINDFFESNAVKNVKPILAGHNIKKFDNPFMEKFFEDNKKDFSKSINPFVIDTLEFAYLKWFNLPNFTLGTCVNEVGLVLEGAHRAINDTRANANLLIKMLESLRGDSNNSSEQQVRRKFNLSI